MSNLDINHQSLSNPNPNPGSSLTDIKVKSFNSSIDDLFKCTKSLKNYSLNDLPTSGKVLLLICNPYFNTSFKLGNPVCNDCKIISEKYISHDYISYCLLDCESTEFIKYLTFFLNQEYEDFVIYYSGHGVQLPQESYRFDYSLSKYVVLPENEIEEDKKDECLLFSDNQIIYDDELTKLIKMNKCQNVLMICDCCHAETMLDSLPNNTCLLTSCKDSEKSIQIVDNGIFTYYLIKYFESELTEMMELIKMKIMRYGQNPKLTRENNRRFMFL